jgi:ribonuclease BN (tRNA processing enzyme)
LVRTLCTHRLAAQFELIDLDSSQPVQCGPFSIECRRTIHSIPTFAFRIHTGNRVFGYSADTAYDPSLIEWLAAADLIVHEVTTMTESAVHTSCEKLAGIRPWFRSKMRLTHYPDDFDAESSAIEPLRQGRIYEV